MMTKEEQKLQKYKNTIKELNEDIKSKGMTTTTLTPFYDYDITSDYGYRTHPITKEYKKHNGIDFALPLNTAVGSNVAGEVVTSTYNNSYGNYVVVKDYSGKLHYYAHLNERNVNVGDKISIAEVLGYSGSTGNSTGAHLHYEVKSEDKSINYNPHNFLISNQDYYNSASENVSYSNNDLSFIGLIFKYIIIVLLIILMVYCFYKSIDI